MEEGTVNFTVRGGPLMGAVLIVDFCFDMEHWHHKMNSTEEYAEFLKKVERTIYVDNISPDVTESVLKAAFNQFGNVTAVQFNPVFMLPNGIHAVLVEMENRTQAEKVLNEMGNLPFMIGGMPRPVRAKAAKVEMFEDRPRKPGRRILCRWLHPSDPKCEVAMKIKKAVKIHAEEESFLLERQLAEEENLAKTQNETLRVNHKKLMLIEDIFANGTANRLKWHYEY